MKIKKRKLMTDKDLWRVLIHIDKSYFDGKLPDPIRIRFVKNLQSGGAVCDGCYSFKTMTLSVDDGLRGYPDYCHIVVAHECVHAMQPNYVGDLDAKDHGMIFKARIFELFHQGAYDSVL